STCRLISPSLNPSGPAIDDTTAAFSRPHAATTALPIAVASDRPSSSVIAFLIRQASRTSRSRATSAGGGAVLTTAQPQSAANGIRDAYRLLMRTPPHRMPPHRAAA